MSDLVSAWSIAALDRMLRNFLPSQRDPLSEPIAQYPSLPTAYLLPWPGRDDGCRARVCHPH